eukprot:gnl/TRDRNA2_/TRDRNA2_68104_c0_seq1.p2 gnl/TRDRNA2_/TRDRNA2_68104_c0~~gnl/TRDRNA2_/TRDRNA2_68104_c0_seq1.p2  ORF type:complete len:335 (-),score=47.99 gnl/TRDRNA2_/TRDRNA2_68104_c0_seq1:143-1147(-)
MGAYCMRDCERTAHEYTSEDSLPVQAGVPGLSYSYDNSSGTGRNGTSNVNVKVGNAFTSPQAAVGAGSGGTGNTAVPPVPNWFQVQRQRSSGGGATKSDGSMSARSDAPLFETPRFESDTQSFMATPRGSVASEFRTPRDGEPGASPRDSPRAPDERGHDLAGVGGGDLAYEGSYRGAMKHGVGRLRMNGCTYEGDFLNDLKNGNGVLTWDDGRQYCGQFKEGKFHGSAVMTWPDGRRYCGQYVEDRKHGEGTFTWQDGRRYKGQWVVGKRHGVGVYTNAKGLTRKGSWQMDRPVSWEAQQAPSTAAIQTPAKAKPIQPDHDDPPELNVEMSTL